MEKLYVDGGTRLSGKIRISGSKNSSLPILAATLLTDSECILRNVPDLSDTNYMVQILSTLGAEVERASGNVIVKANKVAAEAPYDLVRKMRASVCVLGPMLARNGEALVSLPGGCVIGDRPIDLHLRGLEALGAEVEVKGGDIKVTARSGLRGANINMSGQYGSTVLGTDNVMMAAVFAVGETIIEGAAAEPEVEDLAKFLNSLGAKIEGAGTSRIVIHGVEDLSGGEHVVIPDRIEAGTFCIASTLAKGNLEIKNVNPKVIRAELALLKKFGAKIKTENNKILIKGPDKIRPIRNIKTREWPGVATDMQSQLMVLMCKANGKSTITENIFENRFLHVGELQRLGANIQIEKNKAIIEGNTKFVGAELMSSDLRASVALVLAAIVSHGKSIINRIYHLDRGYEDLESKLRNIGVKIRRVK